MKQPLDMPAIAPASDVSRGDLAPGPGVRLILYGALLCGAYYAGTLLGFALMFPSSYFSIIWPPNTILLVGLLCSSQRHWPWLLLAVFPVHILAEAQFGVPPSTAVLFHVYNCILVVLTAVALRRFGLDDMQLGDLRRAVLFALVITVTVAVSSLVWSPAIVSFLLGGDLWMQFSLASRSNLLPFLIATPCLVMGVNRGADILGNAPLPRYVEFSLLGLGLIVCIVIMFMHGLPTLETFPALFPLPFLLWSAVRFGPAGLSFSFLIFALAAMFDTITGNGPFVTASETETVLGLQIFLLALYIPLLVLASVVEERQSKEDSLRQSEARYRAVVEDQTELICRYLPDGALTFVNDAYSRHFQRARGELLRLSVWKLLPPEEHQALRAALAALTPARPVASREQEFAAAQGSVHWLQWRDRALFDDAGRIVEYQSVGHDITERKRLEEATQRLAHAGRLAVAGELTASIAHELNQPLNAILNNVEAAEQLLQADDPSLDETRAILADIRKDDVRASKVIRRLQDLLRKRQLAVTVLDINNVMNEVVGLVSSDARRRGVSIEMQLASRLPPIRGDRVHLQQVLLNLVLNAMDAMSDTPAAERRIVMRTEANKDQSVTASVRDAGHGIPPDKMLTVFESFFTTKDHGMGLGLAIARSIIEIHGGKIWASNKPGGGATFAFTLPGLSGGARA